LKWLFGSTLEGNFLVSFVYVMTVLPLEHLKSLAAQVGLSIVTVARPDELAEDRSHLEAWQEQGLAAEMAFMERPSELLSMPAKLLPSVKSIVVIAVAYDRAPRPERAPGYGRIARYAWGRDYHKVLRRRLEQLLEVTQSHVGHPIEYRVFADSVPLLERALARRSGLGFIGKNTMAIIPKEGSFFLLGELLWNLEVARPTEQHGSPSSCGTCTSCLTNCPTGAFVKERVLDAGRCISYLTIEKRSALSYQEREWIGEWVFGCDICQDVCPFNIVPLKKRLGPQVPELGRDAGVGPVISLERVLRMRSDEEYRAVFQGTAVMRAKREGLARNAAVVAANTHAEDLLPLLGEVVRHDPSPLVRQHAVWSAAVMASRMGEVAVSSAKALLDLAARDEEDGVREEVLTVRAQLRNFA
jgi:epoxyqueuosine reductase